MLQNRLTAKTIKFIKLYEFWNFERTKGFLKNQEVFGWQISVENSIVNILLGPEKGQKLREEISGRGQTRDIP